MVCHTLSTFAIKVLSLTSCVVYSCIHDLDMRYLHLMDKHIEVGVLGKVVERHVLSVPCSIDTKGKHNTI